MTEFEFETPRDLRAVLYVRADTQVPHRRDTVMQRLADLQRDDAIGEFEVHLWPKTVRLGSGADNDEHLDVFRAFEAWASRHDVDICPPFDVHEVNSTITEESGKRLVLPEMCLTVYDGDVLAGVYPCHADGAVLTVIDALDAIERGISPVVADEGGEPPVAAVSGGDAAEVTPPSGSIETPRPPNASEPDE